MQPDATEFCRELLLSACIRTDMHATTLQLRATETNIDGSPVAVQQLDQQVENTHTTPMELIFGFQTSSVLRCNSCANASTTHEFHVGLQLESGGNIDVLLETALDSYFTDETVSNVHCDCNSCNCRRTMSKQLHMLSWPRVLVIALKIVDSFAIADNWIAGDIPTHITRCK